MLSVKLATSVSRLSLLLPTLAAVMLRDSAVMSVAASPSTTAPLVLKLTLWPLTLPTVKSPALNVTVKLPVAVRLCRSVAPAALSVKALLAVVLATVTVPALTATLAVCTAKVCSVVLPAVLRLNKPPTVLALTAKALASFT
jgi:hypothetical protein